MQQLVGAFCSLALDDPQQYRNNDDDDDAGDEELEDLPPRVFACRALDALAQTLPAKHVLGIALPFVLKHQHGDASPGRAAAQSVSACAAPLACCCHACMLAPATG